MEVVVVLVIAALALRGVSKPFVGLLALLVVYVVEPGELYPHLAPLHLERTLAVFVLLSFFLHGNKLRFPPVTRWFLAFYGAMILAIPFAFWPSNSIAFCISFVEVVVFHLLMVGMLNSEERIRKFIVTMVALFGWLACTSLFLYATGVRFFAMGIERAEGLTSSGGDANTLGITLVTAMPLEILLMNKANSKWVRLLGLAVCIASVWTVVITGSRTSFFAMLFMVMLLLVAHGKRTFKFIPLLIIAAPLLWLAVPQQYKARYETVDKLKEDDSYQNRLKSWQGGYQMFLHNPLTGVGPDNYTNANGLKYWPEKPRHWLNAHSLFFKLIGELGVLGLITFFGYLIKIFKLNHRMGKVLKEHRASAMMQKFPMYCSISICLLLFTGYSAHNLYRNTWFMLGALSAAVGLLQQREGAVEVAEPTKKLRPVGAWVPGTELAAIDGLSTTHTEKYARALGRNSF